MEDPEPSGSQDSQQGLIQQFKEICAVDDEIAGAALESKNWNLEAAIRVFLDGEDIRPAERFDNDDEQNEAYLQHEEDLIEPQGQMQQNAQLTPSHSQGNGGFLEWLTSYALLPVRLAMWSLRLMFDFFYTMFGGPPRPLSDPREEVGQFVRDFQAKYDANRSLSWLEMSYHSAISTARRQIQFLIVSVHNPSHSRADEFSREYLLSQEFLEFIRQNNCLIWGSSIRSSEGYKVCSALHDFNFPFVALLCVVEGRATCVFRMSGEFTLRSLIDGLRNACVSGQPMLDRMHMERAQIEMDSQLRREQEADYQRSLATDRAKVQERKRLESEKIESQKREEEQRREEKEKLADLENRRREVLTSLPKEPELNGANVLRVAVRFPDGAKIERRFNLDDSLELLFNTVFSSQNCPKDFSLLSSYPRKELRCAPEWYKCFSSSDVFNNGAVQTFREAGFEGSAAVLVRDNES